MPVEKLALGGDPVPALVLETQRVDERFTALGLTDTGAVTFRARVGGPGVDTSSDVATFSHRVRLEAAP